MGITPEEIEELATAPKRTQGDEGSIEEKPIDEVIKADQYIAAKAAAGPPYGIRVARFKYPGTP